MSTDMTNEPAANPMELSGSTGKTEPWYVKLAGLVAIVALLVYVVQLGLSWYRDYRNEPVAIAAMRAQTTDLMLEAFGKMRFERPAAHSAVSMEPALVFEGATSQVLLTSSLRELRPMFGRFSSSVLARTEGGRFFVTDFRYHYDSVAECLEPRACGRLEDPVELTLAAAKAWVFREPSATPADYQRIFGEPMPPRKVPA